MNKRVFISGGASGLGKSLVKIYYKQGYQVCFGDIDTEKGHELEKSFNSERIKFFPFDVTKTSDNELLSEWLTQNWGGLDILINNAGIAVIGDIENIDLSSWQQQFDINLFGVVRSIKTLLPLLKQSQNAHIINISSLGGIVSPPFMSPYNTSKSALISLSESLKLEFSELNIKVSVVCPSFFQSNLPATANATSNEIQNKMNELVFDASRSSDEIARRIFYKAKKGIFLIYVDWEGKCIKILKKILPLSIFFKIFKYILLKKMGDLPSTLNKT